MPLFLEMKKLISLAALVVVLQLVPVGNLPAQEAKKFKIGALTKSLANPYFLRMKEGYDYAQKKLGVELVSAARLRKKRTLSS